jgi:wobble nucleotide-excising tRNase
MIEKICIQNEASYGDSAETLSPLAKFNFIYGSNGSGKTTISRIIANQPIFPHCQITWRGNIPLEPLVYNRDFVDKNFHQSLELKGIFTLGDNAELDKIEIAKKELSKFKDDGITLKSTLDEKKGIVN